MNASAIRNDWVGQVIDGRFTLLQWLGGSARSGVFLTELPGPQGRKAAIKLTLAESDEDIEKQLAGWAATRPLSHPNLMRLLQTGRCEMGDGTLLYSVSEYADEVLSQILPERALTPDEAKEMLAPIVDALGYLHEKGLVHGHLKPSNILVVDDNLKLSGDCLQVSTKTGQPASEPTIYDAPERAAGIVAADGDVWSLGVTLVEALTQKPPVWDKETAEDPMVPEGIPQPLAGIARGCLMADPLGRCNLGSVKDRLEAKASPKELAGKRDVETRAKFPITVLVVALVVVAAVVAVVAVRSNKTEATAPVAAVSSEVQPAAQTATAQEAPAQPTATPQASTSVEERTPAVAAAQSSAPVGALGVGAVVDEVQPEVLAGALASIHGKFDVRIRVTVDSAGNVADASFDSEGPSRYFAGAAMKAVRQWKFKPGQAGSTVLQFRFTRAGAEITTVAEK